MPYTVQFLNIYSVRTNSRRHMTCKYWMLQAWSLRLLDSQLCGSSIILLNNLNNIQQGSCSVFSSYMKLYLVARAIIVVRLCITVNARSGPNYKVGKLSQGMQSRPCSIESFLKRHNVTSVSYIEA